MTTENHSIYFGRQPQRKGHLRVSFLRWLGHSSLRGSLTRGSAKNSRRRRAPLAIFLYIYAKVCYNKFWNGGGFYEQSIKFKVTERKDFYETIVLNR